MFGVEVFFCFTSCIAKRKKLKTLIFRTLFCLRKINKGKADKTKLSLLLISPKIFIKSVCFLRQPPG